MASWLLRKCDIHFSIELNKRKNQHLLLDHILKYLENVVWYYFEKNCAIIFLTYIRGFFYFRTIQSILQNRHLKKALVKVLLKS